MDQISDQLDKPVGAALHEATDRDRSRHTEGNEGINKKKNTYLDTYLEPR